MGTHIISFDYEIIIIILKMVTHTNLPDLQCDSKSFPNHIPKFYSLQKPNLATFVPRGLRMLLSEANHCSLCGCLRQNYLSCLYLIVVSIQELLGQPMWHLDSGRFLPVSCCSDEPFQGQKPLSIRSKCNWNLEVTYRNCHLWSNKRISTIPHRLHSTSYCEKKHYTMNTYSCVPYKRPHPSVIMEQAINLIMIVHIPSQLGHTSMPSVGKTLLPSSWHSSQGRV